MSGRGGEGERLFVRKVTKERERERERVGNMQRIKRRKRKSIQESRYN
jgi:hypothetical protein